MKESIIYHERGKDPLYKTWHASRNHLMMYFHSGSGSIVCAEKVFPIEQGGLVFIAAGTYHYTVPDDPQAYDRSKLFISPDAFDRVLELLTAGNELKHFSHKAIVYAKPGPKDADRIASVFQEMTLCGTDDERELMLRCCCMRLLFYLSKYSKEYTTAAAGLMGKAIEYINRNISSDLSIDGICAAVGISKYHFCRQFKEYTGLTVMRYILKTRIVLAKSELKRSCLSVAQISERYGFSSVSYFCRVFREEERCTPLQFRRQNAVSPE